MVTYVISLKVQTRYTTDITHQLIETHLRMPLTLVSTEYGLDQLNLIVKKIPGHWSGDDFSVSRPLKWPGDAFIISYRLVMSDKTDTVNRLYHSERYFKSIIKNISDLTISTLQGSNASTTQYGILSSNIYSISILTYHRLSMKVTHNDA